MHELVRANWDHMASRDAERNVLYRVARDASDEIRVSRTGANDILSFDACDFLHRLELEIILRLQRCRTDLFFLHAAAAEVDGNAFLLVGESGSGKSTMMWALLHHGCAYLSDELAPIDLDTMTVYAYPHALCIKQPPPLSYQLPVETVRTEHSFHVPVRYLPRVSTPRQHPISAIIFLTYCPEASEPTIRLIGPGESSVRLYANALNQLSHPNAGLEAAARIAKSIPGFVLESAELSETCNLVRSTLNSVADRT